MFRKEQAVPGRVAQATVDLVVDFNRANPGLRFKKKMVLDENRGECGVGFHLVQVDTGRFPDDVISLGCVIRNHDNEVVWAACHRLQSSASVTVAEAYAIMCS